MAFLGLFDYEKAGKGVSKNGPKKKAFFVFFEMYFRKFWKLIQLNIITFIFCIPIVTIGPALAGMTKVLRNYVLEKNSFIFHDFWKGFSKNFKQSIPVGIVDVIFTISAISAVKVYPELAQVSSNGAGYIILCVISLSFAFTLLMMNFYIMPMIIATDLKLTNIIKNSFFLTCVALKRNFITLLIVALIAVIIGIVVILHPLAAVLIVPLWIITFLGFIIMFNTYPMIQKYVIDPYYEERGEENPEYGYMSAPEDETVFMDKGGEEVPIASKSKKNKTIS